LGLAGVRRYLNENRPAEENIECWFGQPIVSGDRAAVEWWGSWTEQDQELTFAGVPRFDDRARWSSAATTATTSSGANHPTRTGEALSGTTTQPGPRRAEKQTVARADPGQAWATSHELSRQPAVTHGHSTSAGQQEHRS